MAALEILVENGLAVAGSIGDSGFEAWRLESRQAVDRIRHECEAKEWDLGLNDVWLATTEKGDDLARLINVEGESLLDKLMNPSS